MSLGRLNGMGGLCSTVHKDGVDPAEIESKVQSQLPTKPRRLQKMPAAWKETATSRTKWRQLAGQNKFVDEHDYAQTRQDLIDAEKAIAFDAEVQDGADDLEKQAAEILKNVRDEDWDRFYGQKYVTTSGQPTGKRSEGEHFLGNVDIINQTNLFRIAKRMPKGAHLHIHFNSCLEAKFLIQQARNIDTMYIRSTLPLTDASGKVNQWNMDNSLISFMVLTKDEALQQNEAIKGGPGRVLGNIFRSDYHSLYWMPYKEFQSEFQKILSCDINGIENWLVTKCLISEEQAHNTGQTVKGIWTQFNFRTQFMKGLFAYETAFRNYTRACIEDFVSDNIQYAEIRPNFMKTNSVKFDDATGSYDNFQTMSIIEEELENTMAKLKGEKKYFGGMKVIYCTPRVFKKPMVEAALTECLEMKKKFPKLLCGFDLVGEEESGNELRIFSKEFIEFQRKCENEDVEIPFLFHCGESLESGGKVDGNLYDAILLNAKRVGHGYALARHPMIMDIFKKKGMAIESCPISNEILGLTGTVAGHHLHQLLANDVPCTINSDNGTFYRSSLSHDFYQAMVGSESMSLLGWKQLAMWSLEHSCMDPQEKAEVTAVWQAEWRKFCEWIVAEFGGKTYNIAPVRRPGHPWNG